MKKPASPMRAKATGRRGRSDGNVVPHVFDIMLDAGPDGLARLDKARTKGKLDG
ncbi:hypothetical protein LCGC14_2705360, partial [marine sediment metagenome]